MPKKTVISHFWNEEILLPFWLKHHVPVFDHGIMIDYDSTDSSVDIIRELAPKWEIRKSEHKKFDARLCDQEVMSIEQQVEGWKIGLNTTEFLLSPDLNEFLQYIDDHMKHLSAIVAPGYLIIDTEEERSSMPSTASPLLRQRYHGFSPICDGALIIMRARTLHKQQHGNYGIGRHYSLIPEQQKGIFLNDAVLAWTYWTMHEKTKNRKMRIQNKISDRDKEQLIMSTHMLTDEAELEDRYSWRAEEASNLLDDPVYRLHYDRLPLAY